MHIAEKPLRRRQLIRRACRQLCQLLLGQLESSVLRVHGARRQTELSCFLAVEFFARHGQPTCSIGADLIEDGSHTGHIRNQSPLRFED